jgi:hypothetical protein
VRNYLTKLNFTSANGNTTVGWVGAIHAMDAFDFSFDSVGFNGLYNFGSGL